MSDISLDLVEELTDLAHSGVEGFVSVAQRLGGLDLHVGGPRRMLGNAVSSTLVEETRTTLLKAVAAKVLNGRSYDVVEEVGGRAYVVLK
jgi:hypothetical protein